MSSPQASAGPEIITARFGPDAVGDWTPEQSFFVDPDLCRRYAAATNEPDPPRWARGVAPPLLAVIATVPHVHQVLQRVLPDRVRAENRSVHGEHDMRYHEPVVPGSTLAVRGRLYGIRPRSTGTALITHVQLADAGRGRVVHEQYFVNFLRGVMTTEPLGSEPAGHRLPDVSALGEPAGSVTEPIDADQTFRYADASGDRSIYHLDDAAARAAGFPGIIVHGLCTMAFAGRAVTVRACGGDASRLRRLAVRFSRPMYPGHAITTTLWRLPPRGTAAAGQFCFRAADDQGGTVLTDGLAEVARAAQDGEIR